MDYGDFGIPAASKSDAESILAEIRALIVERQCPGEWSTGIEEAEKRVYLLGGERQDYYVLVTGPWKPTPDDW